MGVKEYRFLTRTMKTITTRSNKIAKAKERLSGYEDKLKDFRKRASRLRANEKKDILRLKDGEALVKEELADLREKLGLGMNAFGMPRDRSKIGKQIAKLDKRLSKIDSELKNPKKKKEISGLETKIKKLVKLRDSTKKEIKLLEREIPLPQLWDSIAHLIPFSTALEKA